MLPFSTISNTRYVIIAPELLLMSNLYFFVSHPTGINFKTALNICSQVQVHPSQTHFSVLYWKQSSILQCWTHYCHWVYDSEIFARWFILSSVRVGPRFSKNFLGNWVNVEFLILFLKIIIWILFRIFSKTQKRFTGIIAA